MKRHDNDTDLSPPERERESIFGVLIGGGLIKLKPSASSSLVESNFYNKANLTLPQSGEMGYFED